MSCPATQGSPSSGGERNVAVTSAVSAHFDNAAMEAASDSLAAIPSAIWESIVDNG